jgi:hypothetical protein
MNFTRLQLRKSTGPMHPIFAVLGLIALICLGASLFGCPGGDGTPLHKAIVSADVIANSLSQAATINHTSTLETPAEKAIVAGYIAQAVQVNVAFTAELKTLQNTGGALTTQAALADFYTLTTQIDNLQTQGILHIKNPGAQALFNSVMQAIRAAVADIQLLTTATSQNHKPRHSPALPLMALALTAEELEAIISLLLTTGTAAASLIEKLTAMKGETDAQLLADADAQNAAALAATKSDIDAVEQPDPVPLPDPVS